MTCSTMFSFLAWLTYPKSRGEQEQSRRVGSEGDKRVLVGRSAEDEDEESSALTRRDS